MTFHDIPHLARHLMEKHGLLQQGWAFQWDNARRRAGRCNYHNKTITLSRHYAELNITERLDDIIDTVLHEIAHALTPGHHHDKVWQLMCVQVGAKPERCYDRSAVTMPRGRLVATCRACGREFHRHKRMRRGYRSYCAATAACGPDSGRLEYVDTVKYPPPAPRDALEPPKRMK